MRQPCDPTKIEFDDNVADDIFDASNTECDDGSDRSCMVCKSGVGGELPSLGVCASDEILELYDNFLNSNVLFAPDPKLNFDSDEGVAALVGQCEEVHGVNIDYFPDITERQSVLP